MLHELFDFPIISASFVTAMVTMPVLALVLLALIARRARIATGATATDPRRVASEIALGAGLGALAGFALAWTLGDVMNLFGVVLSWGTRGWTAAGGMGLGIATLLIARSRRHVTGVGGRAAPPRRLRVLHSVLAVLLLPLVVVTTAVGINSDLEQYPNIAAAFGLTRVLPLDLAALPSPTGAPAQAEGTSALDGSWKAKESLVARGRLGSITIPSTVSGFAAREALVYLPPGALVKDAPELPVVVALSGQPGSPVDIFASGRFGEVLDGFARTHGGLAPIVVVPDQLGAPDNNPMCVDSPLGNSATYLTVDVPAWIKANLRVRSDPASWSMMGFSQGGTCASQIASAHPEMFGSFIDIAGELAPTTGPNTVNEAFGGSQASYAASFPAAIMEAHKPYADTTAFFCVGENDQQFRPEVEKVAEAARAAGMDTRLSLSLGTSHDWGTVYRCLSQDVSPITQRLGFAP